MLKSTFVPFDVQCPDKKDSVVFRMSIRPTNKPWLVKDNVVDSLITQIQGPAAIVNVDLQDGIARCERVLNEIAPSITTVVEGMVDLRELSGDLGLKVQSLSATMSEYVAVLKKSQ